MAKFPVARVFVAVDADGKVMKLGATALNAIKTAKTLPAPTQHWKQLFTKGEVNVDSPREFNEGGNDQVGMTNVYIKSQKLKAMLPLETTSFVALMEYSKLDPAAADIDVVGFYAENSGVEITNSGATYLIYDKNTDLDNNSDVPDPTGDTNAQVIFNGVNLASPKVAYNGEQDVYPLEITGLANMEAGSAKGLKGAFGTFTFAA